MQSDVIIEWCTCMLYMLAASSAIRCWWKIQSPSNFDAERRQWLLLASFLVVFGINKVADLQTIVLSSLKAWALFLNLAHAKLMLKMVLAGVILLASLIVAGWLLGRLRNLLQCYPLILLGLACLASYYLVRAADFLGWKLPKPIASEMWILEVVSLIMLVTVVGQIPSNIDRLPRKSGS